MSPTQKEQPARNRREKNTGGLSQRTGRWLDKTSGEEVFYTYWQATKDIPKNELPEGVERRRISGNGSTKAEAQRRLSANVHKYQDRKKGKTPRRRRGRDVGSKTVSEWFKEWHEGLYADEVSLTVRTRYAQYFHSHVAPYIGDMDLRDLSGEDVRKLFHQTLVEKKKIRNGVETDEPLLGPASRLNILKTFNNCMNGAVSHGIIPLNPVNQVRRPRTQKPESSREVASNGARMKKLFGADLDRKEYPYFAQFLFQFLGLRQSERLGLTWDNVRDLGGTVPGFSEGFPHIVIDQQIDRHIDGGGWYLKQGTKSGEPREIPLFEPFLTVLREHKERMDYYKKSPSWRPPPIFARSVFLHPDGSPITPRQDTREWHKLLASHNIPYFRGHQTRHITATWLADDPSISMPVVRSIIGHDSEAMGYYYARTTALQVEQGMVGYGDRVFPQLSIEAHSDSLETKSPDGKIKASSLLQQMKLKEEQDVRETRDVVEKILREEWAGKNKSPAEVLKLLLEAGVDNENAHLVVTNLEDM